MARMIPAIERVRRARLLIQKARDFPVPADTGRYDLSYIAGVKDLLRQAIDLIKFIPNSPSATPELKSEVAEIYKEAEQAEKEILHR
ncbi:MAG: hypothetical protein GYA17_08385 [Chloroflexi bacterium]|jgi:hypothetical protein|nr:hypothetical protein [Anaerolineaceae bacterium]NMB88366.1 hypothetical protein [Chloroflexota bacterium]